MMKKKACNTIKILVLSVQFYHTSCFVHEHRSRSNIGSFNPLVRSRDSKRGRNAHDLLELHLAVTAATVATATTTTTTTTLQEDVMRGLNHLYPPDDLSIRNSMSRTDGYWSYISAGEEPPIHLTYGEFDFFFFADLLEKADLYLKQQEQEQEQGKSNDSNYSLSGRTFVDIGSGTGRLVIGAAALHPALKLCKGIEILPGIHYGAVQALEKCLVPSSSSSSLSNEHQNGMGDAEKITTNTNANTNTMTFTNEQWKELSLGKSISAPQPPPQQQLQNTSHNNNIAAATSQSTSTSKSITSHKLPCPEGTTTKSLPLSPIQFSCGSFEDPYEYIGDADIVFVFSTCWTKDMMTSLAKCIGRQCKPGTIAITTEFLMPLSGVIEAVEDDPDIPHGEYKMVLEETLDGYCGVTGGVSTAYIHRVVRSLYDEGIDEKMKVTSLAAEKR